MWSVSSVSTTSGCFDLVRNFYRLQLESSSKHGTLQKLAVSAIVAAYQDYRDVWINSMPCLPRDLRQEICKLLMCKGILDNDLFSLCVDPNRKVWDLRTILHNFTSESCTILSQCKSLELLRLSHPSCSSEALGKMLQNLTKLRLLEVTNTEGMNDEALEVVASHCPNLEVLNVQGTAVTDKGMMALKTHAVKLKELDINNTNISRVGVDYLTSGPMKETLKLLHFRYCPMLGTGKAIRHIVSSFPNVKDYSFDFAEGEDQAEIVETLNQFPGPTPGHLSFNIPF
ncbi:unnamed protein product [Orchesella dallaii]|uniref:Uncharacterized protein n=1 Tax=Orchesella dallaii TaxID=48710 RepID=A0ABP1PVZ5_9HEXA